MKLDEALRSKDQILEETLFQQKTRKKNRKGKGERNDVCFFLKQYGDFF